MTAPAARDWWPLGNSVEFAGRLPAFRDAQHRSPCDLAAPVRPRLLSRPRIVYLCATLLAVEISFFIFIAAGTYGLIVLLKQPTSTDFVSFYAAGSLADAGMPHLAYDQAAHYAAEAARDPAGYRLQLLLLSSGISFVCGGLARLPYIACLCRLRDCHFVSFFRVMRRILGERGWAMLIPILAFPPVLWTIGVGQNGFLTAGLLGAATLVVDRRPVAAGLLFGALCCKPHFALLVPVALAAGGRWAPSPQR